MRQISNTFTYDCHCFKSVTLFLIASFIRSDIYQCLLAALKNIRFQSMLYKIRCNQISLPTIIVNIQIVRYRIGTHL